MTRSRDIADSTKTLDVDGGTIKLDGNYPVGTGNVALGDTALSSGSLSGVQNTALGSEVLASNTSGARNTSVGYQSLDANTSGSDNVSVGRRSLTSNTTGINNAGLGTQALALNTTGGSNTAIGVDALLSNTTASNNTAVGYRTIKLNTTGYNNTAVGKDALGNNSTGINNTAVGDVSLNNITTGGSNTAVGAGALVLNITPNANTALGYYAGGGVICNNGANTFIGETAGYKTSSGHNTFIGREAGYYVTSGQKNTILGKYSGNQGGLDIRTSSNNIVLSDGDGNPRVHVDSGGNVGIGRTAEASSKMSVFTGAMQTQMNLGRNTDGSMRTAVGFYSQSQSATVGSIKMDNSSVQYNTSSDHRLKENVDYTWDATTRLKLLKPARFNFIADPDTTVDGFLAHEAQAVVPESVSGTHNEVDADGNPEYQGIDQSKLVPLLVKTIQELEARITALEA